MFSAEAGISSERDMNSEFQHLSSREHRDRSIDWVKLLSIRNACQVLCSLTQLYWILTFLRNGNGISQFASLS